MAKASTAPTPHIPARILSNAMVFCACSTVMPAGIQRRTTGVCAAGSLCSSTVCPDRFGLPAGSGAACTSTRVVRGVTLTGASGKAFCTGTSNRTAKITHSAHTMRAGYRRRSTAHRSKSGSSTREVVRLTCRIFQKAVVMVAPSPVGLKSLAARPGPAGSARRYQTATPPSPAPSRGKTV